MSEELQHTPEWRPLPKQEEALMRTEFEVLLGGARGGGKTEAGIAALIYDLHHPKYRALVIRRNSDDLNDWLDRADRMYRSMGGVRVGQPARFEFPSGAVIRTGHLKDANAYMKYQGHEYQKVLIEELTQISREQDYLMLISSCRSSVPELRPQIFATTNPGGLGHEWVKERFRCDDPQQHGKPFMAENGQSRIFVPSTVYENPYLMKNDPGYVRVLEGLPDTLKKQWLHGVWDDFDVDGAVFGSQFKAIKEEGRITRVPFDPNLPVYTFWDLGYNDTNTIWFVQRLGMHFRFIDYHEHRLEGLLYYLRILKEKSDSLGYSYQCSRFPSFNFPHDFRVHDYGDGKSREDKFKMYGEELFGRPMRDGVDYQIIDRMSSLQDGIESARDFLPYCSFNEATTKEGVKMLQHYRFEFDAKKNRYKDKPAHDEASHAASAFMTASRAFNIHAPMRPKQNVFHTPRRA